MSHPLVTGGPPDFSSRIPVAKPLVPKKHAITTDYTILTRSLGVGVNGKVLECIHKPTGDNRALKVRHNINDIYIYIYTVCLFVIMCWLSINN